jgi:CHASE2 domain-containing sensor protein
MFNWLLARPEVSGDDQLKRCLWDHQRAGGFENALAQIQNDFLTSPNPERKDRLDRFQAALSARDVEAAVRRAAIVTEHGRSRIPSAVHLPQHVLAAAGEELMIRFPSERVCPTAFHARKGTNSRLQNLEQQWTKERHYTTHIVRGAKAEEAFPEFIARRGRPLS